MCGDYTKKHLLHNQYLAYSFLSNKQQTSPYKIMVFFRQRVKTFEKGNNSAIVLYFRQLQSTSVYSLLPILSLDPWIKQKSSKILLHANQLRINHRSFNSSAPKKRLFPIAPVICRLAWGTAGPRSRQRNRRKSKTLFCPGAISRCVACNCFSTRKIAKESRVPAYN